MKKLYFLFVMGAVAWGCGDKDRFMVTSIPTTPVLNAELKVIIKDNTIMNVRLDSTNNIRGITNKNFFATANEFQNFSYNGYSLPNNKITAYSYNRNTIVVATGTHIAPVINVSID